MKYKFTQLKELPDSPTGTVTKCIGIVYYGLDDIPMYKMVSKDNHICYHEVGKCIFDNPDWYKKEIDYDELTDLQCPYCGSTKGTLIVGTSYNSDYPETDDVYPDTDHHGVNYHIALECVCGRTRDLMRYGAKRKYVTEQCELIEKVNNINKENNNHDTKNM